jgi:phosphatidylglycerophosphate synthase
VFDRFLRPAKDTILVPLARAIGAAVHPNLVSVAAFVFGAAAVTALLLGYQWTALAAWLIGRVVDGLDGAVARYADRQSDFGGYLDFFLDVVVYSAVPIALALFTGSQTVFLLAAILLAAFYINIVSWLFLSVFIERYRGEASDHRHAGEAGEKKLTSITMPSGVVEGTETIVLFTLAMIIPERAALIFAIMALLTLATALQHLVWGARNLR